VSSKPSKEKILDHVVAHVTPQWYELGIKLLNEKEESHLDIIKVDNADKKMCCKEMFWHWLSTDTNASWQQLIKALKSPGVGLPVVAADLERILTGS